ncbi:hypothetical protein MHX53_02705 [Brevibacterium sp. ACRRH]|uniref:hypothetical protein n=1 Tax=Brevibacterium sp. ACRRH TaxID=2918183 RepID=UPI001EF46429|nr:hypothetical protein [Brevibacterium sp. ACRRH]MCG7297971.1 hypothetical protein [Brevibacterium sp. ACRRH]
MSLKYDLENVNTELPIDGGVAAFDPVSLRLAAQALSDRGGTVQLLPNVAGTQSPILTQLATVAAEPAEGIPTSVVATVDTRRLRWDRGALTPKAVDFTDYTGEEKYGVDLGRLPVADMGDTRVTCVDMLTEGDESLTVWFAELPAELTSADARALTDLAVRTRDSWEGAERYTALVTIPAQQLTYMASPQASHVEEWDLTGLQQKFAAAFDETGARVIAQTAMFAGAFHMPPPARTFGERGPVVLWFTEEGAEVPFSIIYTAGSAWLKAGTKVDIDSLQLP